MTEGGRLRIGEFSRRTGVSPELLRAWETRYGLVDPERTPGGLRLYTDADERRVGVMRDEIAAGLSAAEAARVALRHSPTAFTTESIHAELDEALAALDEAGAQEALDRAFTTLSLATTVTEVLLPFLRVLGDRWAAGERTVAQEHFASNVIAGRLRAEARGWGDGDGPRAVLACPDGERHELGLLCFGLLLRERGWRIVYLGATTPVSVVDIAAFEPDAVVLSATTPQSFFDAAHDIRALREQSRVLIGGAGASEALGVRLGVAALPADMPAAVDVVAGS